MKLIYTITTCIWALSLTPKIGSAQLLTSTGPSSGSSFSTSGTGTSWSNSNYVQSSDANYSTATTSTSASYFFVPFTNSSNVTTVTHTTTGFGFNIPSSAVISGVTVEIQRKYANSGSLGLLGSLTGSVTDNSIYLTNAGSNIGSNNSIAASWNTTESYYTIGSSTHLWSASLTPAIVNSSSFGISLKADLYAYANSGVGTTTSTTTAYINHIRITVHYFADSDGDGIVDNSDIDIDNDGIMDGFEVTSCAGSQSLNWNSITDGTNPTSTVVTNSPVTMTVTSSFTTNANTDVYEIRNYFTGTSEKEIHIHQTPSNYSDKSTTTIHFSTPIFGTQFKLQDIDYQAGTWIDSVKLTLFYRTYAYTLTSGQVTTSANNTYKGSNWILGKTGNSGNSSLDGQVIINFPYMIDKIVIEYYNHDAAHGGQRMGIGGFTFCHMSTADSDGDGIPNFKDLDSDNDGITDLAENFGMDADNTGTVDCTTDANNDGMKDCYGSNGITLLDFDGDGVYNYIDLDSDNDGIPDIKEVMITDANSDGRVDGFTDTNGNGLKDALEGSSLALKSGSDSNSDGIVDSWADKNIDRTGNPNPYDLDSDGDGIVDAIEAGYTGGVSISFGVVTGTRTNGWATSVQALSSFTYANTDGQGNADFLDIDSDDDGITDNVEAQATASYKLPNDTDTDNDGIADVYEVGKVGVYGGSGLSTYDFDTDGLPDYIDTDTDNDGVPDCNEGDRNAPFPTITQATINASADTDDDGLKDLFDNVSITSLSATNYYKNVTMSNMGTSGNFDGPTPSGSLIGLQQSDASADRDWRNISILPIHIIDFTVQYYKTVANIKWQTEHEAAVKNYEVQFSKDGINFNTVGVQQALNITKANYAFAYTISESLTGTVFFRIKQQSADGKYYFTKIIPVKLQASSTIVSTYPNPFVDAVNIQYTSQNNENIMLRITGNNGQQIVQKQYSVSKGSNVLQLNNLAFIKAGTYHLQILNSTNNQVLSIIKVN